MPARNVDIEVLGLRELRAELRRLGGDWPKELQRAHQNAAEIVEREAERRAPRGPHEGGGAVRPIVSSIRSGGTQRMGYVAIGGAASPHGPPTEFGGTIPRRGFKGVSRTEKRKGKIIAGKVHAAERFKTRVAVSVTRVRRQAFLYPAIDAKRAEVLEAFGEAIDRLTRRAFPKGS